MSTSIKPYMDVAGLLAAGILWATLLILFFATMGGLIALAGMVAGVMLVADRFRKFILAKK